MKKIHTELAFKSDKGTFTLYIGDHGIKLIRKERWTESDYGPYNHEFEFDRKKLTELVHFLTEVELETK